MGSVRKQTYISKEQERLIKRLAEVEGLSEPEILRRAVSMYLESRGLSVGGHPLLELIAAADSGGRNGSVHHDEIYDDKA